MTLEIILFTLAVMFGILLYWRESKRNSLYRLFNRLTHTKELQMKSTDRKGFLFNQPLPMRIIYVVLLFLVGFLVVNFLTPINIFNPKFFATTIVGTLAGTYLASLIVFANEKIDDSQDVIEETLEKGKGMLSDLADDVKEKTKSVKEKIEDTFDKDEEVIEKETKKENDKKSGRDRLKDKGLL